MSANDFSTSTIKFRSIREEDIHLLIRYWHKSSDGFILSLGVDRSKLLSADKMRQHYLKLLSESNQRFQKSFLVIEYQGRAVGCHLINQTKEGRDALFHAHIWDESMRGKGLCTYTYPRACQIFMDNFKLEKIKFLSPVQNKAIHRVKEKMGLSPIGETPVDLPIMLPHIKGISYEMTKKDLVRLLAN